MAIRKLPGEVSALMHSSSKITSPVQCVLELVLNSLDARASSIAIRIDLERHKIQVVDNGKGMSENTLKYVGVNYMTNKHSSSDNSKYYGSRGEALANIHTVSSSVIITSRSHESSETYTKVFANGQSPKIFEDACRPAQGTTVTVNGCLSVLSLRQAYLNNNHEMNSICTQVENLALANTKVSFSIRDDDQQVVLLRTHKANNPLEVLEIIYGIPIPADKVHPVHGVAKTGFKLNGVVGVDCVQSSVIQRIFVNRRPVRCIAIKILITRTLIKVLQDQSSTQQFIGNVNRENILFLLYLECPTTEYTFMIEKNETQVEFHNWKETAKFIKTSISNTFEKSDICLPVDVVGHKDGVTERREIVRPHLVVGEIAKRKNDVTNFNRTSTANTFKKTDTSLPVDVVSRIDCVAQRREIERPHFVAEETAKQEKNENTVNLLMTPKNVDSLSRKHLHVLRRHGTTNKKHLPKAIFSNFSRKLRNLLYIGSPLALDRLCIYRGKPKRSILKKMYRCSRGEVPIFDEDMFKVNLQWRRAIWQQTKRQICHMRRCKTVNESRREQIRKRLNDHRRKFAKNIATMSMCKINARVKRTIVESKGTVASNDNALVNFRDENTLPSKIEISRRRRTEYNVSEDKSIENEVKGEKTVTWSKRIAVARENVSTMLKDSIVPSSNLGIPKERQDMDEYENGSIGKGVESGNTDKVSTRIDTSNHNANLRDGNVLSCNLEFSRIKQDNVSKKSNSKSIGNDVKCEKTVTMPKGTVAFKDNVLENLNADNLLSCNFEIPKKRLDYNVFKDQSIGKKVNGEKTVTWSKRIVASNDNVSTKLKDSIVPTSNLGIPRERQDYNGHENSNLGSIGKGVESGNTVQASTRIDTSNDNALANLRDGNVFFCNIEIPRIGQDYNMSKDGDHKSIGNEMTREKTGKMSKRITVFNDNLLSNFRCPNMCSSSLGISRKGKNNTLSEDSDSLIGNGVEAKRIFAGSKTFAASNNSVLSKFKDGYMFSSNLGKSKQSKDCSVPGNANHGSNANGMEDEKTVTLSNNIPQFHEDILENLRDLNQLSSYLDISRKSEARNVSEDSYHDTTRNEMENENTKNVESQNVFIMSPGKNDPGGHFETDLENLGNNNVNWLSRFAENIPEVQSNALLQKSIVDNEFCSLGKFWGHNPGDRFKNIRQFSFIPATLNALLYPGNNRLTKKSIPNHRKSDDFVQNHVFVEQEWNNGTLHRRQDMDVRLCAAGINFREFTLGKESLKHMLVLGQMNREFILTLVELDGRKLLVIMDQHAVDERIRYETLLREYTVGKKNMFVAVKLVTPIVICVFKVYGSRLLLANQKILEGFGLQLRPGNNGDLVVNSVPKCFANKRFFESDAKLLTAVRKLLQEIMQTLISTKGVTSILPAAIHHAIATEACHGAIKFGDPLTLEQCGELVESLQHTSAPGRCAHGRPSFVPLLDLAGSERRAKPIVGKLNFASLHKEHRKSHRKKIKQNG